MFYSWLRPLLFQLDPERAHRGAECALRRLSHSRRLADAVRTVYARPAKDPVELFGLEFPHPIGLAAGFDKNASAPLAWWALGFGFIELGTVTPRPQAGNPRPRMFRDAPRRALINRMGFNNLGAAAVAERMRELKRRGLHPPFPVGISVGKNKDTPLEQAAGDYRAAAAALAAYADFLTVNVSSPNTPGLRELQTAASANSIIAAVRGVAAGKPVLIKLAPELAGEALRSVLDAVLAAGAAGVIATNTLSTAGSPPRLARGEMPHAEQGGLSGRPLHEVAVARVRDVAAHVGKAIPIIGCGGVDSPDAARDFFDAGAKLVQLYTGMIYEGPFLAARISRALAGQRDRPRQPS